MNCKKCLHYKACNMHYEIDEYPPTTCDIFEDKSLYCKLPFAKDTKGYGIRCHFITYERWSNHWCYSKIEENNCKDKKGYFTVAERTLTKNDIALLGRYRFTNKAEAEAKLKELNND